MKWVVLGDIGWHDFYHLGDEAMTEVAIEQLQARGATQVTLVSARVEVAQRLYGCDAVPRIGFHRSWGMVRCAERLANLDAELQRPAEPGTVQRAIRDADAVLIAGGGNLNSEYFGHLYERVAFARIAKHYGVPLFVTSQTVGPALRREHESFISEIVDASVCFGAREATTHRIVQALSADPTKVVHTCDDAVLMQSRNEDRAAIAELWAEVGLDLGVAGASSAPILASFTSDPGASEIEPSDYLTRVTTLLDDLAEHLDSPVLLVPHSGRLDGHNSETDQELNRRIVAGSRTGRIVTAARMLTAREQVAAIAAASMSISSRYHPLVFGSQACTPAVGIALSSYSTVRMRGALANAGLERWVVPSTAWHLGESAAQEMFSRAAEIRSHLTETATANAEYQAGWWDAIMRAANTGSWARPQDLNTREQLRPAGQWSSLVEAVTPTYEMWGAERARRGWAEADLADSDEWRKRAQQAEGRKIVRFVDRLARMVRR